MTKKVLCNSLMAAAFFALAFWWTRSDVPRESSNASRWQAQANAQAQAQAGANQNYGAQAQAYAPDLPPQPEEVIRAHGIMSREFVKVDGWSFVINEDLTQGPFRYQAIGPDGRWSIEFVAGGRATSAPANVTRFRLHPDCPLPSARMFVSQVRER